MNSKKRLMPRLNINLALTVQYSGRFEWSSLRNLSGGGVFIKTNNPLPVDYTLTIRTTLPDDSEILDIEGRVAWIKINSPDSGMGIEFTKISTQHQEKIISFVERRLREAQEDQAAKLATEIAHLSAVENKE